MSDRPRLLDLFCGAGGAAMGYNRAGFDVIGIDIEPQPNYPFAFVQDDALRYVEEWGYTFAAIHASPPCQDYSKAMRHLSGDYPRLIDPVRDLLIQSGLPWVIENVVGAPIPTQSTLDGRHGVELCGSMFSLRVYRHRLFETSFGISAPRSCDHRILAMNPHNQAGRDRIYEEFGKQNPEPIWCAEMGVPWMTKEEGREAIPPVFTEYIGHQLLAQIGASVGC